MIDAPIRYFSTNQAIFGAPDLESRIANGSVETVGLAEAIITGQAPDGGLFMPTHFPSIDLGTIGRMKDMPYSQVFVEVMKDFFECVLSKETLERIAEEAYTFEPFLEKISDKDYIARLDEGPTFAFKDYAAQVLFRVTEALIKEEPKSEIEFRQRLKDINLLTYIVATSGDTGGAMGNAILGRDRMWMAILHSAYRKEVSDLQAKQMDNLEGNTYALWLNTNFDGCQKMAQDLLNDSELQYMNLNSANSISIGRLIPQIAYYFHTYAKVAKYPGEEVYFSVPSGNFGDAVAGLFAIRMGLPIKLIIGVNENDVFKRLYDLGLYAPASQAHSSPSNAMNVNWPSNIRRAVQLYDGQLIECKNPNDPAKKMIERWVRPNSNHMKRDIVGVYSISDKETSEVIGKFWKERHFIGESIHSTIEPHGAVAWGSTQKYRQETGYDGKIITFETAHPGKFPETLLKLGIKPNLPTSLYYLANADHGRHYILENNYNIVKGMIVRLYQKQLAKPK